MTQAAVVAAMVPFAFAACGGRAIEQSSPDAGESTDDSPPTDASTCVTVDVSTYDLSCQQASDCIVISAGTVCDGSCACGGSTINEDGRAAYESATSSIRQGGCPCPSGPTPQCLSNICTICTGASTDPPQCASLDEPDTGPSCINVDISAYDQSCRYDTDCVDVTGGEICTDSCACGGSSINVSQLQRYMDNTSGVGTEECPCEASGTPRCVGGQCAICPAPSDPNQPSDCISFDAGAH